jgi:hypothetical protein
MTCSPRSRNDLRYNSQGGDDERAYALRLARSITPEQLKRWRVGTGAWWADEGHGVAVKAIYGTLPHAGALPDGYETVALPIVDEQLEKAGVRLAMVRNVVLRRGRRCG